LTNNHNLNSATSGTELTGLDLKLSTNGLKINGINLNPSINGINLNPSINGIDLKFSTTTDFKSPISDPKPDGVTLKYSPTNDINTSDLNLEPPRPDNNYQYIPLRKPKHDINLEPPRPDDDYQYLSAEAFEKYSCLGYLSPSGHDFIPSYDEYPHRAS
jgi:hypothetical protein